MNKEITYGTNSASNFRIGGYATGDYRCICRRCKKEFGGDKRSSRCLKCAIEETQNKQSAWEMRRELQEKYGKKFHDYIIRKIPKCKSALIKGLSAFYILSEKSEAEAIKIMQEFLKEVECEKERHDQ